MRADYFAWGQQILYVETPAIPEHALLPPDEEADDEGTIADGEMVGNLPLPLQQLFTRWKQLVAAQHRYHEQALLEADPDKRKLHRAQAERHEMLAEWAKQTFDVAVCEHFGLYGVKQAFLVKPSWEIVMVEAT